MLDTLFHALVRYAAPVLVFTAEEVWGTRFPDGGQRASAGVAGGSRRPIVSAAKVRTELYDCSARDHGPEIAIPAFAGIDESVDESERLRRFNDLADLMIEALRRDKVIGSSLEARVEAPFSLSDLYGLTSRRRFVSGVVDRFGNNSHIITAPDEFASVPLQSHPHHRP